MNTWRSGIGMARITFIVVFCVHFPSAALAQPPKANQRTRQQRVIDPPEFTGTPKPMPPTPTAAMRQFLDSKAIRAVDPNDGKTLPSALEEINTLIRLEPRNSDFHFLRASLSCFAHAKAQLVVDDINASISLRDGSQSTYKTLKDHYALKAKVEFDNQRYNDAMRDLDAAIAQDYDSAERVFDDGETKPSATPKPCVWTQSDFDVLAAKVANDFRPPLYRALYLSFFFSFNLDADYKPVLANLERAAALNPKSPLPHFFIGKLYTLGRLGGLMSVANAKCVDFIQPRTPECLALDDMRRTGVRALTRAIAADTSFRPAYQMRAAALYDLKEFRQAIRDYDAALELMPDADAQRTIHNDRGLAEMALGQHREAVLDFTASIALGCDESCHSYDNRADAYLKLHDYPSAIADISASIRRYLSNAVFLLNIDQFRRIYPEYDSVSDAVLCEKLRAMFFPAMSYENFSHQFLVEAKGLASTVLPDLYVKRGDAYAALKQAANANREYDRVSRAFPEWAAVVFTEQNGKRVRTPQ